MNSNYDKHTLLIASKLILTEQGMGGFLSPTIDNKLGITTKDRVDFWNDNKHEILMAAEIGSLFIPGVGPAISMGIAGADAALYWKEGDRYTAGFIATLTLIPVVGSLAAKIPGVKQLGAAGIRKLASKMAKIKAGAKPALSKAEWSIIKNLSKHQREVLAATKQYAKKKATSKLAKKTGKFVKGTGKMAATGAATLAVAKPAWDNLYTSAGLDISDVESQTDPMWQQLVKQAQQR